MPRQQQLSLCLGPIGAVAEGMACPSQDKLDLSGLLAKLSHGLQRAFGRCKLPLCASQLQQEDIASCLACRETTVTG